jgi:flagellar motor switch protein FliN/FliY
MASFPQIESSFAEPQSTALALPTNEEVAQPESRISSNEISRLPVSLDVAVPVPGFRVRDLVLLEPGHVIETNWTSGEDFPLVSGRVQLVWTEFEVVDQRIAVRVTRMV